jgi:hypothetical protein
VNRKSKIFIKIGLLLYNIGWKYRPRLNGKFVVGLIDYFDLTIDTYVGLPPEVEWINLWHEYLHGILHNAGYENHDEKMINTLAHGICQVLADNPIAHEPYDPRGRPSCEDVEPETNIEMEFEDNTRTNTNILDNDPCNPEQKYQKPWLKYSGLICRKN